MFVSFLLGGRVKILCKIFGHKWPYLVDILLAMAAVENRNGMPRNTVVKCIRGCGATRDLNAEADKHVLQQPHTAICAYYSDCYWCQGTGKNCTCSLPCPHKQQWCGNTL